MKADYKSAYGLPARLWKLAMQDALETMKRYWAAMLVPVKSNSARNPNLNDTQRHDANWLVYNATNLASVLSFRYSSNKSIALTNAEKRRVGNYVARQIRKAKGQYPQVRMTRSVLLDGGCYDVFVENGTQYIVIQSMEKGKRITLPLKGRQNIREGSTLRVVLGDRGIEVHVTFEMERAHLLLARKSRDFGRRCGLYRSAGRR